MKILKKLFGGGTKIHVDEIADSQGRLLGDSVIVDSGSNENGSWIKFADGTMICRKLINLGNTDLGAGTFDDPYRTGTTNWIFPQPFVSANLIVNYSGRIVANNASTRLCTCSASDIYSDRINQLQCAIAGSLKSSNPVYMSIEIVGPWK